MKPAPTDPPPETAPPDCPYCGAPSFFLQNSACIYHGNDYGPVYICPPCQAWVGCHPGTTRPLGRLADAELRKAKIRTHDEFDRTWRALFERRRRSDPKYSHRRARGSRYKRLAELLGITQQDCHIGIFDVQQCMQVVDLCRSGALDGD